MVDFQFNNFKNFDDAFAGLTPTGKVRIRFIDRNFVKLLKSPEVNRILEAEAHKLRNAVGDDFDAYKAEDAPTRSRWRVATDTEAGARAEATDRKLSRAAFARAIGHVGR